MSQTNVWVCAATQTTGSGLSLGAWEQEKTGLIGLSCGSMIQLFWWFDFTKRRNP